MTEQQIDPDEGRSVQKRYRDPDGQSGGGGGGGRCSCDPRVLTVLLAVLLIIFCAINLNGSLNSSSLIIIALWGILACTIAGLLLYFIVCGSDDVMKAIVGVGLIVFGILYVIGAMIAIGNTPFAVVLSTLGIALLLAGCAIVLGLAVWQTRFDSVRRNLVIVILLCIASGLIFIGILVDNTNQNKNAWLIAGYITIFVACLLYIILYFSGRGNNTFDMIVGVLIITGGVLVIIGYWPSNFDIICLVLGLCMLIGLDLIVSGRC
mmetsp:Transcript_39649/g.49038  ORF Transcript_39649/g.49038 Transcript_39649/m.49038 type:complete len:264 (+) Transcript_39649:53-844(+)